MMHRRWRLMATMVLMGIVLAVQGCGGGRADSGVTQASAMPDLSWVPPADGFDWIQLKSGEWLKGEIKAVQERQIDFDSAELNELTFDWEDIRQLRTRRVFNVLFEDQTKVSGMVTVTPTEVRVGFAEPEVFPRKGLQSLTRGGSKERNHWSGKGSLGLNLRGGNTKATEYNAQLRLQRRTPGTRFSFDYNGNISSIEGTENANNNRVNSEFDLLFSNKFYLIAPFAEFYQDKFQNVASRVTVGAGPGYYLVDRPGLQWNISTGPAYQHAQFDSVPAEGQGSKDALALVFGSRLDWDITNRIDLIMEYRGQYTSKEVGETTHSSINTLSIELTKRFDLDVSFIWNRTSIPKPDENGVVPKPDDFQLILGVGLDF